MEDNGLLRCAVPVPVEGRNVFVSGLVIARQYVVSPICRNMDLAAKLGKTKNLISSITKMQKETQHGKYNLCRNGCPQGHLFSLLLQIF